MRNTFESETEIRINNDQTNDYCCKNVQFHMFGWSLLLKNIYFTGHFIIIILYFSQLLLLCYLLKKKKVWKLS